jgi:DNA-directed RNA polymerase
MLRDEKTLKAVNVLPSGGKPSDVYTHVMNSVAKMLPFESSPLAIEWMSRLNRNSVKHCTMTTPYGCSERGMRDMIKKAVMKDDDKETYAPFSVSASEAANYLAPLVAAGISDVVVAATEAMDWLKAVATVCGKAGVNMSWTTPRGFKVTQDYKLATSKRHKLFYNGEIIKLSLITPTLKIDVRKSSTAAAPNFVHGCDASHEMDTINVCVDNGVDTFCMVHDSFGTHASSMDILGVATRWTFKEQYSGDILRDLYNEVQAQMPEDFNYHDMPLPPLQGDADLDAVMHSDFFFA